MIISYNPTVLYAFMVTQIVCASHVEYAFALSAKFTFHCSHVIEQLTCGSKQKFACLKFNVT